jgi:hypothetical protein
VSLFVFTAQAVAGHGQRERPGARHAMLIFAAAPNMEEAARIAQEGVAHNGWIDVELLRRKALGDDAEAVGADDLRSLAEHALAEGCAFVVYADPIPPDA